MIKPMRHYVMQARGNDFFMIYNEESSFVGAVNVFKQDFNETVQFDYYDEGMRCFSHKMYELRNEPTYNDILAMWLCESE